MHDVHVTSEVFGVGTHPDLPETLIHFTGRPRTGDDEVPSYAAESAKDRLVQILQQGALRASPTFGSPPVVCASEATDQAVVAMLRGATNSRGAYAPWGLVLSRRVAIQRGFLPVLHLSSSEQTRLRMNEYLPESTEARMVTYDPPRVDWLHEREWRLGFARGADEPQIAVDGLVVGVITGEPNWYPPPLMTFIGPNAARYSYAASCQHLPRFLWANGELIEDGVFDLHEQMLHEGMNRPTGYTP